MTFETINKAVELVRTKKHINLNVLNCTVEASPAPIGINGFTYNFPPETKLEAYVLVDHNSWTEKVDLEYVILPRDLTENSDVNKVIGDISNYTDKAKEILRLAFILYDGVKYGVNKEIRKDYLEKGWHPRVVSYRSNIW